MHALDYRIRLTSETGELALDRGLLDLVTESSFDEAINACRFRIDHRCWPKHSSEGSALSIELGRQGRCSPVFSGLVLSVERRQAIEVTGVSRVALVVDRQLNACYGMARAGEVMRDVLDRCQLTSTRIDPGCNFWGYVIHGGHPLWQQLQHLAVQCHFDLFADVEDRIVFGDRSQRPNRELGYFGEVVGWHAERCLPSASAVETLEGKRGQGRPALQHGRVDTLGRADVALGDRLNIADMPARVGFARQLDVTGVRHEISQRSGFSTQLRWEQK